MFLVNSYNQGRKLFRLGFFCCRFRFVMDWYVQWEEQAFYSSFEGQRKIVWLFFAFRIMKRLVGVYVVVQDGVLQITFIIGIWLQSLFPLNFCVACWIWNQGLGHICIVLWLSSLSPLNDAILLTTYQVAEVIKVEQCLFPDIELLFPLAIIHWKFSDYFFQFIKGLLFHQFFSVKLLQLITAHDGFLIIFDDIDNGIFMVFGPWLEHRAVMLKMLR